MVLTLSAEDLAAIEALITDQSMQDRQNGNALSVHVNEGLDELLTALGVELPYTFTL